MLTFTSEARVQEGVQVTFGGMAKVLCSDMDKTGSGRASFAHLARFGVSSEGPPEGPQGQSSCLQLGSRSRCCGFWSAWWAYEAFFVSRGRQFGTFLVFFLTFFYMFVAFICRIFICRIMYFPCLSVWCVRWLCKHLLRCLEFQSVRGGKKTFAMDNQKLVFMLLLHGSATFCPSWWKMVLMRDKEFNRVLASADHAE